MNRTGKVNIFGLLILIGIVAAVWYGWNVAPAYLDNLDMKEAVSAAMSRAVNRQRDETLRGHIIGVGKRLGTHRAEDDFGNVKELPGLGLTNDNIIIERDTVQNTITITVDYDRVMQLKPLKRWKRINFVISRTGNVPP